MYDDSIILTNQDLDSSFNAIPLMVRALSFSNLDSNFNRLLKVYDKDVRIETYSKYLDSTSNGQLGGRQAYELYLEDGVLITVPSDELVGYKKPLLSGALGYIIKE